MNVKIINGDILVHDNEIYARRKFGNPEAGKFNLSLSERQRMAKLRKLVDDTHPMKGQFRKMLEEKLNDKDK